MSEAQAQGRQYENWIAARLPEICEAVGISVESNVRIVRRWRVSTAQMNFEVDIAAWDSGTLVLVECKNRKQPVSWDETHGTLAKFHRIAQAFPEHEVYSLIVSASEHDGRMAYELVMDDSPARLAGAVANSRRLSIPQTTVNGWITIYDADAERFMSVSRSQIRTGSRPLEEVRERMHNGLSLAERYSSAQEIVWRADTTDSIRLEALYSTANTLAHFGFHEVSLHASRAARPLISRGTFRHSIQNAQALAQLSLQLRRGTARRPGLRAVSCLLNDAEGFSGVQRASALTIAAGWAVATGQHSRAIRLLDTSDGIASEIGVPGTYYIMLVNSLRRLEMVPPQERRLRLHQLERFRHLTSHVHSEMIDSLVSKISCGLSTSIERPVLSEEVVDRRMIG